MIYELDGIAPELGADGDVWVAPTAAVIGKVRMAPGAAVWFGAVLRGDLE
jgi:carbonic anhydrase/acetyltransferase-like protein (isoleucine patch superfamily)